MAKKRLVGILGGAFDPIHEGHLQLAHHALNALHLDEVRFIPCHIPVHKAVTQAKPWQRAAMVALAIVNQPQFILDTREIDRDTPSYTIMTLQSLAAELSSDVELFWLVGEDAFAKFDSWYQWQDIPRYCNLVVLSRQHEFVAGKKDDIEKAFDMHQHKVIYLTMPYHAAASNAIRKDWQLHHVNLPQAVLNYIKENGLYQ